MSALIRKSTISENSGRQQAADEVHQAGADEVPNPFDVAS